MDANTDISYNHPPEGGVNKTKMNEIKLKVGKTYRSREGKEVKIVAKDIGNYAYQGSDGEWYTESGRYAYSGPEHRKDLIAEVPETRHAFTIPGGVKEITLSYEGKSLVVEMVPTAGPKPGDVCINDVGSVYILKAVASKNTHRHHAWLGRDGRVVFDESAISGRPATPEEAQPLWDALKRAGKRWNPETMRVEDVPEVDAAERCRIMDYLQGYANNAIWNYEQLCWLIEDYIKQKEDKK